jgi:hypothetical protein
MADVSDFTIAAWVYWNASSNWARVFDFGTDMKERSKSRHWKKCAVSSTSTDH